MSRVEIPAPGDLIMDDAGNVRQNVTVSLKLAGTATDVTHYSALTGGTSTTGGLKSGSDGTIVDGSGNRRYVDAGVPMDLLILGRTRQIEALSASDLLKVTDRAQGAQPVWDTTQGGMVAARRPFLHLVDTYGADPTGAVDASSAWATMRTDAVSAGSATAYLPRGTYKASTTFQGCSGLVVKGDGKDQTVIDCTTVASSGDGVSSHYIGICFQGTVSGTKFALSRDARKGDAEIWTTSDPGLAVGDQIVLHTDCPRGTLVTALAASGETTVVWDLTAGVANPRAKGMIIVGGEKIAYSSQSISVGGGAGGKDRVTATIRTTPSAAFGRGVEADTTVAAHLSGVAVTCWDDAQGIKYDATSMFDRGEQHRVAKVVTAGTGAAVGAGYCTVLEEGLYDDYPSGTEFKGGIRKVTPMSNFEVRDLRVDHHNGTLRSASIIEFGVSLLYCDNFVFDNFQGRYAGNTNLEANSCTRGKFINCRFRGKAQSEATTNHAYYAISLNNSCQWMEVVGQHSENTYQCVTITCNSAGQSWWGMPRHISVTASKIVNSGILYIFRHHGFITHGGGEFVTFTGCQADGVYIGFNIQSGSHVTVVGGTVTNWARAAIAHGVRGCELHNVVFDGIVVGARYLMPGRTSLTADPGGGGTTLAVTDTTRMIDAVGASDAYIVRIDSELIRVKASTFTTTSFTSVDRGWKSTTAAAHSIGADVIPYGYDSATGLDIDYRPCQMGQRAYNQPITQVGGAFTAGGTTLDVGDNTSYPAATTSNPQLVWVEGEDSARYFEPGVYTYTGKSGGNLLTGITAALNTKDANHSAGVFAMPFEYAISDITYANLHIRQSQDYYGVIQQGYVPTRNVTFNNVKVTYLGGDIQDAFSAAAYSPSLPGFSVQAHGCELVACRVHGFRWAFRISGHGITAALPRATMDSQVISAVGGYAFYVEGERFSLDGAKATRTYQGVRITATALNARIKRSEFQTFDATTALVTDGPAYLSRDCVFVASDGFTETPVGASDDPFMLRRSSEVSTMPRIVGYQASQSLSTGVVYGAVAQVKVPGSYSKIRALTGSTTPGTVTQVRLGVHDSAGARLTDTGDLSGTITTANTLYDNIPLAVAQALTVDQILFLSVGWAGTTLSIAGIAGRNSTPNAALGFQVLGRTASGYATGNLPTISSLAGSSILPWIELVP